MRDEKLDFWLEHEQNVLFEGRHGVGKTAMIKSCFERAGLTMGETFLYFSASTLDPWVDLVGVPKEKTIDKVPDSFAIIKELANIDIELAYDWVSKNWKMDACQSKKIVQNAINREDGLTYLDLVRPKAFAQEKVEALFFDEFNRSPKKVRNAVMECLQFKSINGKTFPNLKVVWAAINPEEEDEYDVEKLDPAQLDRFHIRIKVNYKPSSSWFISKYGERVAKSAISWWDELPDETKKDVSPRRLEYALNLWEVKGDISDILPVKSNCSKLRQMLNVGPANEKAEEIFKKKDLIEAKSFINNENNYNSVIRYIIDNETLMDFYLPLVNPEKIAVFLSNSDRAAKFICSSSNQYPQFQKVMKDIINADLNKKVSRRIRIALESNKNLLQNFSEGTNNSNPAPIHFAKIPALPIPWQQQLDNMKKASMNKTQDRLLIYDQIANNIPEKLTEDEAISTLDLINSIFSKTYTSTIANGPMHFVVNIINHCIEQYTNSTDKKWADMLTLYGNTKLRHILSKLKDAGKFNLLLTSGKKDKQ